MFTEKAQSVIDLAKDLACSDGSAELGLVHLLAAVARHSEGRVLLAEAVGLTPDQLLKAYPELPEPTPCPGKLPLGAAVRNLLNMAKGLAEEVPDRTHPGLIDIRHLACAIASSREAGELLKVACRSRETIVAMLAAWYERDARAPRLDELTEQLRKRRDELLAKVFGQNHAVHSFVEGLFNAEVVAAADTARKGPQAIFVFAGPPGVGKTYLAELGASMLDRPFKRFDMTAFSGHEQNDGLIGMAKMYRGAHPGALTEFVEKNPNALLLFDEIEKAHQNTIQLFLQLLDAGTLEDKFHERNVTFRDTIIIFTTNAGRSLYDRPNASGIHQASAAFHRKTILSALETEADPRTGQPYFPAAICSRMATGYPVLFNHLGVNELERVVRAELTRVGGLIERQYYKQVAFDDLVQMCLVLREGARSDARTLRAQAEAFVKTELLKVCQLFETNRLEDALAQVDTIRFALDQDFRQAGSDVVSLFEREDKPHVLLVATEELTDLYKAHVAEVDWLSARASDAALEVLAEHEVDMVLLDIWIGRTAGSPTATMRQFDRAPAAARRLASGQELLRRLHERAPAIPVYLFGLDELVGGPGMGGRIDEELLMACIRGGGARGIVSSCLWDETAADWQARRDRFAADLLAVCARLYREKTADRLGREHKVLTFETAPRFDRLSGEMVIRLRDLRLSRAIAAADAGEVLEDVERPRVKFDDVIGADAAKEELKFFVDYLRNPKRFAALGLKPPKGVLLYGPPGTGKTMLARAIAGESDVAFLSASASGFVTIWQGSGPQNVRDLFARARRYAPAIVFIDEIDAIGRVRTGGSGGAQATETTLNALLTEMDGFTGPSADRPVFVLAATNFQVQSEDRDAPERSARTLDPALVRRFSRAILVDLPDTAARRRYLSLRIGEAKRTSVSDSTLELFAEKSVGMSIADLEQVIETAGRKAAKGDGLITDDILLEAIDTAREGEAKQWSPEFLERTARHEAGHTIMYWLSGWLSPEVSIIARGDHGGGMRRCEAEIKRESLTREEMLARIRVSLGGRAAEMLYYGQDAGLATGASGDLENATNLARQMICRYGMDGEFGLLAAPELLTRPEAIGTPVYQEVNRRAGGMLKDQMDATLKSLEQHRSPLDTVARTLIEKNRLHRKDLELLLPASPSVATADTSAGIPKEKEADG
jgi:ATP-dependent metalloprotease FtsH